MVTRASRNKALTVRQRNAIARALADPRRFEILKHIARGECMACTVLRDAFPITPATLSHHLKELEAAELIETSKRGKFVDAHFCRQTWAAYLATLAEL